MSRILYHGGAPDLEPGDLTNPLPRHATPDMEERWLRRQTALALRLMQ